MDELLIEAYDAGFNAAIEAESATMRDALERADRCERQVRLLIRALGAASFAAAAFAAAAWVLLGKVVGRW